MAQKRYQVVVRDGDDEVLNVSVEVPSDTKPDVDGLREPISVQHQVRAALEQARPGSY